MRTIALSNPAGVQIRPDVHSGVGALVVAGSSGRIDEQRARLLAAEGALAESIRWFGGPGQHAGPWKIPIETFLSRIDALAAECDRVVIVGTSFGAEAMLVAGSVSAAVGAVVGFAPSDVVWAGVTADGRETSHWTLDGNALPYVAFDPSWEPDADPPRYRDLYARSRELDADRAAAATIAVERIPQVLLVAGGDDQVWPSVRHAELIAERREAYALPTAIVTDPDAGHRAVLPGEEVVAGGTTMRRGGSEEADRRLGAAAWDAVVDLLAARH